MIENVAPPDSAGTTTAESRPLCEFDPEHLGVHRAVQVAQGQRKVPSYVTRPHDRRLQTVLRQFEADTALFLLVVGGSSTGKSRTAYEALRRKHGNWKVFIPGDARDLSAFLRQQRARKETIVWLDEAQRYFGGAAGADVARALSHLVRSRQRVLVVGTIWLAELNRLEADVRTEVNRMAVKINVPRVIQRLRTDAGAPHRAT